MARKKWEVGYPQPHRVWRSTVLAYLERDGEYLMIHRNRSAKKCRLDQGNWTAVGGRRNWNEIAWEAMLRTVPEETGLTPTKWKFHGLIELYYSVPYMFCERVYVFTVSDWEGELKETCDRGTLHWVKKEKIHNRKLWHGDRLFLKALSDGRRFFHLMLEVTLDGEVTDAVLNTHRVPLEEWNV